MNYKHKDIDDILNNKYKDNDDILSNKYKDIHHILSNKYRDIHHILNNKYRNVVHILGKVNYYLIKSSNSKSLSSMMNYLMKSSNSKSLSSMMNYIHKDIVYNLGKDKHMGFVHILGINIHKVFYDKLDNYNDNFQLSVCILDM